MRTYKAVCTDASPLFAHAGAPPLTVGKVYTVQDTGPNILNPSRWALEAVQSGLPATVKVLDPDPEISHGRYVKCDPRSMLDKFGSTELKLADPYATVETPRAPVRVLRDRFEVL